MLNLRQVSQEPIQFAAFSASSAASNVAVAAKAGHKIRLLGLFLSAAGTVDITVEDGTSGTNRIGLNAGTAQFGYVLPLSPVGWTETAVGVSLNILLGQAIQVGGCLVYQEIPV